MMQYKIFMYLPKKQKHGLHTHMRLFLSLCIPARSQTSSMDEFAVVGDVHRLCPTPAFPQAAGTPLSQLPSEKN